MEVDISGAKVFFTIPIDFPLFGKIQISETLVVSWIVMALITGLCIWLTRDLKVRNISKRQAVAEMIVETANKFVIGNMGEKFRYLIPFVSALFATSVVSNLISLIGLRSPTADLSTEAAWAVVVFIMITTQKIKTNGFGGYLKGFTTNETANYVVPSLWKHSFWRCHQCPDLRIAGTGKRKAAGTASRRARKNPFTDPDSGRRCSGCSVGLF